MENAARHKKLLCITVDVEALPFAQSTDHVERLIWGKFGEKEIGINRIMDIAEKYGKKCTFFVDYCETFRYPGAFEIVSKRIVERGHDLQLHAHTTANVLPHQFWAERGITPNDLAPDTFNSDQARALIDFLYDCAVKMSGNKPTAFRGGNFRFNEFILEAMRLKGMNLSFNYNVASIHQPNNKENLPFFRWSNGVYEMPITAVEWPDPRFPWKLFDFNIPGFGSATFQRLIDRYYNEVGWNSVLVMLMHSWSFCARDKATGYYEYVDDELELAFERFMSSLPADIRVVTASELNEMLMTGQLKTSLIRNSKLVGINEKNENYPAYYASEQAKKSNVSPIPAEPKICNYCGAPLERMFDFGNEKRCPDCWSLPRQRVFLWAYERFIRQEFDLTGKRILMVCPSNAILGYLYRKADLVSCDIMPVKWFNQQTDICNMPEIPDNSFEAVIAKSVLHHCYDDEAALDEIKRILKPWGRVFLHVSCNLNAETTPIADITKHYGKEALEQYRVGTYRYYGDRSFLRMLQKRFLVKTFYGMDPVTGITSVIYCGIKDGDE